MSNSERVGVRAKVSMGEDGGESETGTRSGGFLRNYMGVRIWEKVAGVEPSC